MEERTRAGKRFEPQDNPLRKVRVEQSEPYFSEKLRLIKTGFIAETPAAKHLREGNERERAGAPNYQKHD